MDVHLKHSQPQMHALSWCTATVFLGMSSPYLIPSLITFV